MPFVVVVRNERNDYTAQCYSGNEASGCNLRRDQKEENSRIVRISDLNDEITGSDPRQAAREETKHPPGMRFHLGLGLRSLDCSRESRLPPPLVQAMKAGMQRSMVIELHMATSDDRTLTRHAL